MDAITLNKLIEQVSNQSSIDWVILISALFYVLLASKGSTWCWAWGIISCGLWAYVAFVKYNLWADGVLQVFYVVMGFWGIYAWKFQHSKKGQLAITRMVMADHLKVISIGFLLTLLMGYLFSKFTPTSLPYPDSFITSFSVLCTILTVRKKLENWLYWIVVDLLAVALYFSQGAILMAQVMLLYAFISIFGFYNWRQMQMGAGQGS